MHEQSDTRRRKHLTTQDACSRMRRVLVVSPRFPPVNAADMHRVRQSLPYFRDFGWEATVLAVEPHLCAMPIEPLLGRTIPEDIRVIRTGALRPGWFGLGNLDLRAMFFMARAGSHLLASEQFDLVYFSTTAFSIVALGRYWQRRFGVPFVLDLQDPWYSEYYEQPGAPKPPGGRLKYAGARNLARLLERFTMRRVSHIISVSPTYPADLQRRYEWLEQKQFSILPFGAAAADFEVVRREAVTQSVFDPADGYRHWVYVGRAGGDMAFSLRTVFLGLARARAERPNDFARLRLHFIGTDYAPSNRARKTVEPIAFECGVGDLVEERTARIPYFEALSCLLDADVLMVLGSDDPGYTASKLYPYILAQKPLVAVFHEQSSVVGVINSTKAGTVVTFSPGESVERVAERVWRAWFRKDVAMPPETDWGAFEPFTAREMTRRQCEVFDSVVERRDRGCVPASRNLLHPA